MTAIALTAAMQCRQAWVPTVAVDDIVVRLGHNPTPVLNGVSLEANSGEFVCLLGPSGCGKSTLLKTIAGFITADSGQIRIDGRVVTGPGTDRGMVFQEFALFPWFTVKQNVLFGDQASKGSSRERQERAQHYLSLVGLWQYRDYYPAQLSGGMKQRVALARAWANQPAVLLMDEPFGALDARTRQELQAVLLEIFQRERTLCLFVTHDAQEAVMLAGRIVVMSGDGSLRYDMPIAAGYPRDKYAAEIGSLVKEVESATWEARL